MSSLTRWLRTAIVFHSLPWIVPFAHAQVLDLSMQAVAVQPETVVTATKIETPVEQSSASLTTVTQEEIQQQQVTDVLEVFRDVPGFTLVQSGFRGGTTSLFSRGGESNYNLLLIDGVRANLAGGAVDFANFTTLGIDRVEIVRGPQSALYGSDAISSVIQLFTPRGEGPPHAFLRFSGGNYDTFEEQVGISGGTSLYGYYLAAERVDTDGHLSINNDYSDTSIASRFDIQPFSSFGMTSTIRYIDSRLHFPTGSNGDRFDPEDPRQFSDRKRLIFGNRFVHTPTSWWHQTLQLGLAREESSFHDAFDPEGDVIDSGSFLGNTEERRLSADYTSLFFLPMLFEVTPTFSIGAYIEDEHFDQRTNSAGTIEKVNPSRNSQAGYAQLLLQWREQVFITSGFRVDDSSTFRTEVTPRFLAAYILPWTQTKLRGGYGEGIKAPTFVENFGIGSPFIIGNPDLKPEKSESWEVGIEQPVEYGEQEALLSLTYFSAEYENLIGFLFDAKPNFVNVQRTRSRGLEAGVRVSPMAGLTFVGTYTYLDTKVLDAGPAGGTSFVRGKSLVRRPDHTGSLTINYAWQRLNANFNITVKGNAIDSDFRNFPSSRVVLDGYTKADLALSYRLLENCWHVRSLALTAKVQNLFDEDYEEVFGFSSPGANFLLGFVAEF